MRAKSLVLVRSPSWRGDSGVVKAKSAVDRAGKTARSVEAVVIIRARSLARKEWVGLIFRNKSGLT